MAVICDKAGQMPPGMANLLWLAGGALTEPAVLEADLARVGLALRQLAERKDDGFFTRRGFESAAGFLRQYSRLSGIVVRQSGESLLWLNPLARHKPPREIVTAIQRLIMDHSPNSWQWS